MSAEGASPLRLERGLIIAEKFRLERRIATGGMGSVWRAHHLALEEEVAVKFMDPALLQLQA